MPQLPRLVQLEGERRLLPLADNGTVMVDDRSYVLHSDYLFHGSDSRRVTAFYIMVPGLREPIDERMLSAEMFVQLEPPRTVVEPVSQRFEAVEQTVLVPVQEPAPTLNYNPTMSARRIDRLPQQYVPDLRVAAPTQSYTPNALSRPVYSAQNFASPGFSRPGVASPSATSVNPVTLVPQTTYTSRAVTQPTNASVQQPEVDINVPVRLTASLRQ